MQSIFSFMFSPILILMQKSEREKLTEFIIIFEFNPDLVLNDEEITFKPNINQISKLINFTFRCFRDSRMLGERFPLFY